MLSSMPESERKSVQAFRLCGAAIKAGFSKAFSAIFDGNITTLIAAFVLMWLGSGTVKGFAYTLALGIVISMFTSLVVSQTDCECTVCSGYT